MNKDLFVEVHSKIKEINRVHEESILELNWEYGTISYEYIYKLLNIIFNNIDEDEIEDNELSVRFYIKDFQIKLIEKIGDEFKLYGVEYASNSDMEMGDVEYYLDDLTLEQLVDLYFKLTDKFKNEMKNISIKAAKSINK